MQPDYPQTVYIPCSQTTLKQGSLDERWEKVISRIKKTNSKAASAITRIPPSSHFMFGGDHTQLAKVVQLTKDLSSTANRSFTTPRDKPKYKGGYGEGGGKP